MMLCHDAKGSVKITYYIRFRIPAKVLGVILTAAYMAIKGRHILKAAIDWKNATAKLMKSTVSENEVEQNIQ